MVCRARIDAMTTDPKLIALIARCDKARDFPAATCGASRHAQAIGDDLAKYSTYPMLSEEPEHCAATILAVVASLWEARARITALEANLAWVIANVGRDIYNAPGEREGIRQDAIARLEGKRKADKAELAALAAFNEKYRKVGA